MNEIVVTLLSPKPGELKRFLSHFSDQMIQLEDSTFRWSSSFLPPLKSSLLLSTLLDNEEEYHIDAYLSLFHQNGVKVTSQNINEIMQVLYILENS